jgi:uncharacterized protein
VKCRKFGRTGFDISVLGFGAMRLPENPDKSINEKESIAMLRHGIDRGINYIDTAYVYHDGKSEGLVAKALKDGYRKKVKVATKSPMWLIKQSEDFDRILDEQLARLQSGAIDYYLMHGLGRWSWDLIKKLDLMDRAQKAVKSGKIAHIGFSFHDDHDSFREIIDGYDKWEFCQIQYNYMDEENQAGKKGLKYAVEKGVPVIVMEPLLGGRLANPPKDVRAVLEAGGRKRTPADWALQWIWDHPEVSTILSGMSTMEQLKENIGSAERSAASVFSEKERGTIADVRAAFGKRAVIPCTKCNYCMPCPQGVNIPKNFEMYNEGLIYDDVKGSRIGYTRFFDEKQRANLCSACKTCEENCPQKISISEMMPKVHSVLGEDKPYIGL